MIANPTVAPTAIPSGSGSGLTPGTYRVAYAWRSPSGSTLISPTTNVTIILGQNIAVTVPPLPLDAVSTDIFMSLTASSTVLEWVANTTGLTEVLVTPPQANAPLPSGTNTTDSPPPYVQGENEVTIRTRMLQNLVQLAPGLDIAQGSFLWDLIDIPAIELALVAIRNNNTVNLGFIATTRGQYLDFKGSEHGVTRIQATPATGTVRFVGSPNTIVPLNTRVATASTASLPAQAFVTTQVGTVGAGGTVDIPAVALVGGIAGNVPAGAIVLVQPPAPGIATATNPVKFDGGLNAEADTPYQTRILRAVQTPSAGGNLADYINWTLGIAGVGGVSVVPVRDGSGTVSVAIIDTNKNPANQALIDTVQNALAPPITIISQTSTPGAFSLEGSGVVLDNTVLGLTAPTAARLAYNLPGPTTAPTLSAGFTTPQITTPNAPPSATASYTSPLLSNPLAAPTVAGSGAGSAFAAGTYLVAYAWRNANGTTLMSPTASVTITAGQNIVVTLPALPTGAGSTDVYCSTATGGPTLALAQNTTTATATLTSLPTGQAPPPANTTGTPTLLVAGNYTVAYSWRDAYGATMISPTATVTILAGQQINVGLPVLPGNATSSDVYLSVLAGSSTLAFAMNTLTQTATLITVPVGGATSPPTANSTGTPTNLVAGTYTVAYAWRNSSGTTPSSPTATVNIGLGQTIQVTLPAFPTGIVSADIYVSVAVGSSTLAYVTNTTTTSASVVLLPGTDASSPPTNYARVREVLGSPTVPFVPTQPGIWQARVRLMVDQSIGTTPFLEIGVWSLSSNSWAATRPGGTANAVSVYSGSQLPNVPIEIIQEFYWNGVEYQEVRVTRKAPLPIADPVIGPTLGSAVPSALVGNPAISPTLSSGLTPPLFANPTTSPSAIGGPTPPLVPNPTIPPGLATAATGGTLPAGTYTVGYSWTNGNGESALSPTAQIPLVGTTSTITVTIPALAPGASGANIYISGPNGSVMLRSNGTPITTTSYTVTAPAAGTNSPVINTTGTPTALTGGNYVLAFAYRNVSGSTQISPTYTVTITSGQQITVNIPALPSGVTGIDVYMSTVVNGATLALDTTVTTAIATITALPTGAAPPATNTTNAASSLIAATYQVAYAWRNLNGTTLVSPATAIAITAGQQINVSLPALPLGAVSTDVYVSASAGSATLALSQGTTTTTAAIVALPAGGPVPVANTTGSSWLAAGTYQVAYAWRNDSGTTLLSPSSTITLPAGQYITVALPPFPPNALSADIYLSTTPGGPSLAFDVNTTSPNMSLVLPPPANAAAPPTINVTAPDTARVVWVDYVKLRSEFSQYTGGGKAPVGARVTVEAGGAVYVNVNATLVIAVGYDTVATHAAVSANIIAYLQSIAYQPNNTVRLSQVGNAILNTPGVLDYQNLLLNGVAGNVPIGVQQVALLGIPTYN